MTVAASITPRPTSRNIACLPKNAVPCVERVAEYTISVPRHAIAIVAPTRPTSRWRHGALGLRRNDAAGFDRGTDDGFVRTATSVSDAVQRGELDGRLRLEAGQLPEHTTGDRRGRRGAEAGLLHDDGGHVLRIGHRAHA